MFQIDKLTSEEQKVIIITHFLRSDTGSTAHFQKMGITSPHRRLFELREMGFPISQPEKLSEHGGKRFKIYEVTDRDLFNVKAGQFIQLRNKANGKVENKSFKYVESV